MKPSTRSYARLFLESARTTPPHGLAQLAARFWQLVWKHRQLNKRHQIVAEIEQLWYRQFNTVLVEVAVPHELSPQVASRLRAQLAHSLGQTVELKFTVKPHLLSGAVVTVGDQRFDASLKGRLDAVYERLAGVTEVT